MSPVFVIGWVICKLLHKQTTVWKRALICAACTFVASFILAIFITPSKSEQKASTEAIQQEDASAEEDVEDANPTRVEDDEKDVEKSTESQNEKVATDLVTDPDKGVYVLNAGDDNEFSFSVTYDEGEGSTFTKNGFMVPGGNYTVENIDPRYKTQVTAYSQETIYEDGIEYPADSNAILVDSGETKDLEVPDGWWIYITEPAHIVMTRK